MKRKISIKSIAHAPGFELGTIAGSDNSQANQDIGVCNNLNTGHYHLLLPALPQRYSVTNISLR